MQGIGRQLQTKLDGRARIEDPPRANRTHVQDTLFLGPCRLTASNWLLRSLCARIAWFILRGNGRHSKGRVREFFETALLVFVALVVWLGWAVLRLLGNARLWFQRHVYFRAAPFRTVRGPYVLVLRSFSNRMAIGRRIRRIVRDEFGRPIDAPDMREDAKLVRIRRVLEGMTGPVDLGEPRPDLTLLTFLGEVRHHYGMTFVGVSNGSSLGGVLRLVHAPDDLWFEAMKALAIHAQAILVIPDDSPSLVMEVEHVMKLHAHKVAFLMPPSDTLVETRWDIMKEYLFEGVDLSNAWRDTRGALMAAGVVLPDYEPAGRILRCHPDGSLCEAKLPWNTEVLNLLVERLARGASDAQAARRSLRSGGLRLLRYPSPAGSVIDDAWYQRQFREDFHVRDARERQRLARLLPWLGYDRADHVMAAPLPGERRDPSSPYPTIRCHRCPPDVQ